MSVQVGVCRRASDSHISDSPILTDSYQILRSYHDSPFVDLRQNLIFLFLRLTMTPLKRVLLFPPSGELPLDPSPPFYRF